jgi:hypothetical protein
MDPSGQILLGMWNDWHFNDGCGISYSTNGGTTWAPESFAPGFTFFTNDPSVPGTGPFAVAGDPVVVYNPKSRLFDVICQSFGGVKAGQIQLLATTFDVTMANPSDPANSYGLRAWRPLAITTGTEWLAKGRTASSRPRSRHCRHRHRSRPPLRAVYVAWASQRSRPVAD